MKRVVSLAIAAIAGQLVAGTYTWTGGAEDNNWTSVGNWNYNGEPAANAPAKDFPATDSVLINGNYTVNYNGGGDPQFKGPLTITGGATWRQTVNAYPRIEGKVIVDGGSFYTGTQNESSHHSGYGYIEVRNNGFYKVDRKLGSGFIRQSLLVESNGRVEVYGNDLTLQTTDSVKSTGTVYCDQDIIVPAGVLPGEGSIIATNASKGLLKPQNGAVFRQTAWECRAIHPDSGSVTTLRSGSLRLDSDWSNGFEQEGGAYLDYVTGSAFTLYIRSFTSDVYGKTFGSDATNPKFRLNGEVVAAEDFATKFTVADAGEGFVSIVLNNSATSALFNESSVEVGTSDSSVYVSATFERTGEPAATVYLAYDTEDKGSSFSAWQNKIEVGAASAEGFDRELVTGVTPKADLVFRLFVGTAEEFDVSDPTTFYTRYYGEELRGKTVREWIGGSGDSKFTTQSNWLNGRVPAKSGDWYTEHIVVDIDAEIDYDGWGDLMPQSDVIVKITGGAKLVQSVGNWPNIYGRLILDNGLFDSRAAGEFRFRTGGEIDIVNGGILQYQTWTRDENTTLVIDSGSISSTKSFKAYNTDQYNGGQIVLSETFRYGDGTVIDGTSITAAKLVALASGDVITFQSGSLTITGTSDNGFANNGGYINVTADSTASFTFPFSRSVVEANVLPKFRLNGIEITAFDEDAWQVVETTEGNVTTTTFTHKAVSGTLPLVEDSSASLGSTETTASVTATVSAGAPLTSLKVKYGTSKSALSDEVAYDGTVGDIDDGAAVSFALSGLVPHKKYYYQIVAANEVGETATLCTEATSFITFIPSATSAVWTGAQSELASNPANWSGGSVPSETSDIMISDTYAERSTITWDLPITVHSWTQESFGGGNVLVRFETTKESPLTITGNVLLGSGANWTHTGPAATPEKCINVIVGGNMTIESDAYIQAGMYKVNNSSFAARGYINGPGYNAVTDGETTIYYGGSHAGDSGHSPYAGPFPSYGLILDPCDWGSAGKGDTTNPYSGPGLVILKVAGTLTVNGTIASDGYGYGPQPAGASGGSVNITAARIAGTGVVSADGGPSNTCPGSGGRIAIKLTTSDATFESFSVPQRIHANPGVPENYTGTFLSQDCVLGAAGTILLKVASDGENSGRVVVSETRPADARRVANDADSLVSGTHLPSKSNPTETLRHSIWSLNGYGKIRLTANASIGGLSLSATDGTQCVFTDGYTLTTASLVVNGTRYRYGTYTAETNPEFIKGDGSIVVGGSGFILMVR